ncbi:MAG: GNAT family N-acetyltransferase [Streptosporangiaceae bacterium]
MITVTPAEPRHAEALAALLEEMDRFYCSTANEPLETRLRQISDALFASPPAAYALLAWDDAQLVGFAAYSFLWPAVGLTRSLYLKELYIAEAHRGEGLGKLILCAIFETAQKSDCSRVEWTTDTDNAGAQDFYQRLGLQRHPAKLFYRAEGFA